MSSPSISPLDSPSPSLLEMDGLEADDVPIQPFRFFDLPSELRRKILGHLLLLENRTIDLDPANARSNPARLNLFLASHRMHQEAYHIFYSGHTFRIFPTTPRFYNSKVKSILCRLSPRYRAALVSLEIRLGTGWSKPPKTWTVTDRLRLQDCVGVRDLKVFVECDPSHQVFKGFRVSINFFTDFASNLLARVVERLPHLERVTFDRHGPSVRRDSELMSRLQEAVLKGQKRIGWARGKWEDDEEDDEEDYRRVQLGKVLKSDLFCMREALRGLASGTET